MNVSKLTAAVLAVLVVSTGVGAVAAMPGNGNAPDDAGTNAANAPSDAADANATDARDEGMSREEVADSAADDAANDSESTADPANASEGETPRSEEAADAAAAEERRGPPADLPEQVPDHVSEIHQRIVSFLDGELDNLGAAVSDVTPADDGDAETEGDDEAAANADAEATSTEEPETEEPETEEPETEEPETEEDGDSTETVTATPTTEA